MERWRAFGRLLLVSFAATASCDKGVNPPVQPTPLGIESALITNSEFTGPWIGEYREIRCVVEQEACVPRRHGWIRLVLPRHSAPPTSIAVTLEFGECSVARQLDFTSRVRMNGTLDTDRLSLTGTTGVGSAGGWTTTIETAMSDAAVMRGRVVQNGTSINKNAGQVTRWTREYELPRVVRHTGPLPLCIRPGGEQPPVGPVVGVQEDMAGSWVGEYREIRCETETGARCAAGGPGWARLQLSGPAVAPISGPATVELGTCTSAGTIRFDDSFSGGVSVEPTRMTASAVRNSRQGAVLRWVVIRWGTTILSPVEMFGGLEITTTDMTDGRVVATIQREYEFGRVRKVGDVLPPCGTF